MDWYAYPGYPTDLIAHPAPPGIDYEPGQDWEPGAPKLSLSDFADTLTEEERGMPIGFIDYVSISCAPCGIIGCGGNEWVFMYEGIEGLMPTHCCDSVVPHIVSNVLKGLTGWDLKEFAARMELDLPRV